MGIRAYVTVYSATQAYGGPEEGGWWYTREEPIDGLCTLCCGVSGADDHVDTNGPTVADTWLLGDPSDHAEDCPARGAAEAYHKQYVLGHSEEYLRTFTHGPDGVSWLDSGEDAPGPCAGEQATSGTHYVRIESEPPDASPQGRPHYE